MGQINNIFSKQKNTDNNSDSNQNNLPKCKYCRKNSISKKCKSSTIM